jgi:hypothetical protein
MRTCAIIHPLHLELETVHLMKEMINMTNEKRPAETERDMRSIKGINLPYCLMLCTVSALGLLLDMPGTPMLSVALALPIQGPNGQTCKSSGTTTVNGKQDGKDVKCTADYCTYDECETSGANIGKCFTKTSYSNVRDCKAAAQRSQPGLGGAINPVLPSQLAPVPLAPSTSPFPKSKITAPMIKGRGVEGEPATSAPTGQEDKAPAPK